MFLKTIPGPLNVLASSALVILLLKVFIFNNLPEVFDSAYKLGLIIEGILVSILASYVVYLLVVHMKEINDKKVIYPHITKWAQYVVNDCKSQLSAFSNESGVDLQFTSLTEEKMEEAFTKINPQDNAPLKFSMNNHASWFQFLIYHKKRSKKHISNFSGSFFEYYECCYELDKYLKNELYEYEG